MNTVRVVGRVWLAAGLAAIVSSGARAQTIIVDPAVVVSPPGSGVHFWWTTAASVTDPRRLVACGLRTRERTATVQAVLYGSVDGGASWRTLRGDSTSNFVSEVSCAAGVGGTVYWVNSPTGAGFQEPGIDWGMILERSTDFGAHWRAAPRATAYMDAAAIAIRPGTTANRDFLYVFADGRRPIALSTLDGGRTLGSGLLTLPGNDPAGRSVQHGIAYGAAVLPDGNVGGLYVTDPFTSQYPVDSPPNPRVLLLRLTRDGRPLGAPVTIATLTTDLAEFGIPPWAGSDHDITGSIAVGVLPTHRSKRVYVAWNAVMDGRNHVALAMSDDSGVSWSRPRIVDDIPAAFDQSRDTSAAIASLAVNKDGVVGLQWAEFAGRCWRFAASLDGGTTFLPSVPLTVCPRRDLAGTQQFRAYVRPLAWYDSVGGPHVRVDVVPWHVEIQTRGTGLVATADGVFHPTWVVRGDGEGQLLTARVVVARKASPGTGDGAASDGIALPLHVAVSAGVVEPNATVDFASVAYDGATGEFVLDAVVARRGAVGLRWPVVVRLKDLSSPLGAVAVVSADNQVAGEGATWVVEGPARSLPAGSMAALDRRTPALHGPWTFSAPRQLRFRLTGIPPISPPPGVQNLLHLDVEILAIPDEHKEARHR